MDGGRRLSSKAEQLYRRCLLEAKESFFDQALLLGYGVAADVHELVPLCQELLEAQILRVFHHEGLACYKLRRRDDAARLLSMSADERLIFQQIEAAGASGAWTKTIKGRTNLHQSVITKCLRALESKRAVKQIVNVRFPKRKIYMLADLRPSDEVAGGPWHCDGELDVDLVDALAGVVCAFVAKRSWQDAAASSLSSARPRLFFDQGEHAGKDKGKAPALPASSDMEDLPPQSKRPRLAEGAQQQQQQRKDAGTRQAPHPPGYGDYPSAGTILDFLLAAQVTQVSLEIADLQTLLDMLVFDGRLERLRPDAYRTVRALDPPDGSVVPAGGRAPADAAASEADQGPGNGFSQAPCGKCPVFELCAEDSPVNAATCTYFDDWLGSKGSV